MTTRRILLITSLFGCLSLSGCGGGDKFVKPVAASVAQDPLPAGAAEYKDGYLRIFVTSNLDESGHMLDFGDEDERPAKLLITARFDKGTIANFSSDSEPEIPVLLYDLSSNSVESSVVDNALLTEGLLVDPESLSKSPHLQIIVRGVPPDKARWVTNLLEASSPVAQVGLAFVPGAAVFNPISYKLGGMLSDEIKTTGKPWEERTLLGLRADEGVAALDGRQFVILLNPSKVELDAPPELRRCRKTGAVTGLCRSEDGEPWVPAQPYVRFELDVSNYRSIKDFLGSDVSCEFSERNWVDYRSLINSGQLARLQTDYEQLLMIRGDLLMQIRRGLSEQSVQPYVTRMLLYAQQYASLPNPKDSYWRDHFAERAAGLDACIRATALRGQSALASVWDASLPVFSRARNYPAWAAELRDNEDPTAPLLLAAQKDLAAIESVLAYQELRQVRDEGALVSLTQPQQQLERMITSSYRNMLRAIERNPDGVEQQLQAYDELMAQSERCAICKSMVQERIDALTLLLPAPVQEALPEPMAAPPQPAPVQLPVATTPVVMAADEPAAQPAAEPPTTDGDGSAQAPTRVPDDGAPDMTDGLPDKADVQAAPDLPSADPAVAEEPEAAEAAEADAVLQHPPPPEDPPPG